MKRLVDTYHPETIVSGKRTIRDGSRFNPYFPPPDERDRVIIQDGEVTDTVELMEKVVWKYLDDTKRIAPLLHRSSTIETCNAIWKFIFVKSQFLSVGRLKWARYVVLVTFCKKGIVGD